MGEQIEKRYWLCSMPEGYFGPGMVIRYGYPDITEREFRLYEEHGRNFIGPSGGSVEADIEISGDAYRLLISAIRNKYRQRIRFALQDDHQRYSVDEETCPEGTYLGNPIRDGEIQWADHGIEVRQKGDTCFIARRLANRPVWEGGDVPISTDAFDFLWKSEVCRRIEKVRYEVRTPEDRNVGDTVWYVDRYAIPLGGLVRAKVMLSGERIGILPVPIARVAFRAVTDDPRFRDWYLAKHGLMIMLQESRDLIRFSISRAILSFEIMKRYEQTLSRTRGGRVRVGGLAPGRGARMGEDLPRVVRRQEPHRGEDGRAGGPVGRDGDRKRKPLGREGRFGIGIREFRFGGWKQSDKRY